MLFRCLYINHQHFCFRPSGLNESIKHHVTQSIYFGTLMRLLSFNCISTNFEMSLFGIHVKWFNFRIQWTYYETPKRGYPPWPLGNAAKIPKYSQIIHFWQYAVLPLVTTTIKKKRVLFSASQPESYICASAFFFVWERSVALPVRSLMSSILTCSTLKKGSSLCLVWCCWSCSHCRCQ